MGGESEREGERESKRGEAERERTCIHTSFDWKQTASRVALQRWALVVELVRPIMSLHWTEKEVQREGVNEFRQREREREREKERERALPSGVWLPVRCEESRESRYKVHSTCIFHLSGQVL